MTAVYEKTSLKKLTVVDLLAVMLLTIVIGIVIINLIASDRNHFDWNEPDSNLILPNAFSEPFEKKTVDFIPPKITVPDDIYVKSKQDAVVNFEVTAVDDKEGPILIQCDRTSGSKFKLGKTLVYCMAVDSGGNIAKKSFVVTVGYDIVKIPSWVQQITRFWTAELIDDQTYMRSISYLIKNNIVLLPTTSIPGEPTDQPLPSWIKGTAQSWIDKRISNDEYSIVLQWMVNNNMIIL